MENKVEQKAVVGLVKARVEIVKNTLKLFGVESHYEAITKIIGQGDVLSSISPEWEDRVQRMLTFVDNVGSFYYLINRIEDKLEKTELTKEELRELTWDLESLDEKVKENPISDILDDIMDNEKFNTSDMLKAIINRAGDL